MPDDRPPNSIPPDTRGADASDTESAIRMSGRLSRHFSPPRAADELGRLGGYRILKLLGHGGMGAVFRAEDPDLNRLVALKVIKPELAALPAARERFFREARAAAALAHDHVMPIYRVGEENGLPFIVMPLLTGETLEQRLARVPKPAPALAARYAAEAAEGLAAAHAAGLIHRDVKPANLWLEAPRDRVKILDFGLARKVSGGIRMTIPGNLIGTPAYIPPEQVAGADVTEKADVYSLGVVLYRMLTGTHPFLREDLPQTLAAVVTERPPPAREVNPAVPAELSDLADRLMGPEPQHRPSAEEAAAALHAFLATQSIPPPPPPPPPAPPRPWWRWLLIPLGLLAVGLIAAVFWVIGHPPAPPPPETHPAPNATVPGSAAVPAASSQQVAATAALPGRTQPNPPVTTTPGPVPTTRREPVAVRPREHSVGDRLTNSVGMVFAWCPPRTFQMGSPPDEPGRDDLKKKEADETSHPVTLTRGYFLGTTEVTQRQWREVMGDNPSGFVGAELPVENVSFDAAREFCRRLTERPAERQARQRYRLPTEAEWESACRALTTTAYYFGPRLTADDGNCDDTVPYARGAAGLFRNRTEIAGQLPVNAWGLHDMHGNVWEWVADAYAPYPRGAAIDPFERDGDGRRILRGGCWYNGPYHCRSAKRLFVKPDFVGGSVKNIVGVRVVCEAE